MSFIRKNGDQMNYLNEQTIYTVIDLAERCYLRDEQVFGSCINPFTDKAATQKASSPNPEKDKLKRYIDKLGDNEKAELMALMCIGKRKGDSSQWESLLSHAKQEISDAVMYISEKPLLASYLKKGLQIIRS